MNRKTIISGVLGCLLIGVGSAAAHPGHLPPPRPTPPPMRVGYPPIGHDRPVHTHWQVLVLHGWHWDVYRTVHNPFEAARLATQLRQWGQTVDVRPVSHR